MKFAHKLIGLICFTLLMSSGPAAAQEIYKITVAQDGTGDYSTIQQAIDACKSFPDNRITIFVRKGSYREKVVVPACNTRLSIIGERGAAIFPEKYFITCHSI